MFYNVWGKSHWSFYYFDCNHDETLCL